MDEISTIIQEAISNQDELTDAQVLLLKKYIREFFDSGKSLQKVFNFPDELIEMIYSHTYYLYQSAKYPPARNLFQLLTVLCPHDLRFYLGVAACYHQEKNYPFASRAYYLASFVDPTNPMPAFYQSDCETHLGHIEQVKWCLRQVIERGKDNPKYEVLVDRARLTLDKFEKEHPNK